MDSQHIHIKTLDCIPDLLALHAAFPQRYPHLLASNTAVQSQSRYDILFAFPQQTITKNSSVPFLSELDKQWQDECTDPSGSDLPFQGGWFLYLGYELVSEIEPSLNLPESEDALPIAFATRFPVAVIIDHKTSTACIVCEAKYFDFINRYNQI